MTQTTTTLQSFLATATQKAAANLAAAIERIPEDKRAWSPMGDARTALDQAAEVAILNGSTAKLLETRTWPENYDFNDFFKAKADLAAKGWDSVKPLLEENTAMACTAIKSVPDADLSNEVAMPWGNMTLAQIMAYPYWNACYHEGQINYIASMLGCLD